MACVLITQMYQTHVAHPFLFLLTAFGLHCLLLISLLLFNICSIASENFGKNRLIKGFVLLLESLLIIGLEKEHLGDALLKCALLSLTIDFLCVLNLIQPGHQHYGLLTVAMALTMEFGLAKGIFAGIYNAAIICVILVLANLLDKPEEAK